jgi:hypothetical protein
MRREHTSKKQQGYKTKQNKTKQKKPTNKEKRREKLTEKKVVEWYPQDGDVGNSELQSWEDEARGS